MIRHLSSIAEVVDDIDAAVGFYRDVLGLPVDHEPGGGYATVTMPGALHFSIWSRASAAEATFGDEAAANRIPLGFSVEFEVDAVDSAVEASSERGLQLIQAPKEEPWGQKTSRFILPSGMLGGFSETPWARRISQDMQASAE